MNYLKTEAINAINKGEEIPKKIDDFRIKYVSTDAWRGYYEATPIKGTEWKEVKSSWVTGEWEDAPKECRGSDVQSTLEKTREKVEKLGGQIRVIFLPTSNVFSTAYQVFVRWIDVEELK
jgi:hypothetical protein